MKRANPVYAQQVGHYAARQEAFASERRGDPAWLVDLRANAMARFGEIGFPSTRLESWRYTNVAAIAKLALELGEPRLEIEAPGPVRVTSLADAIREEPDRIRRLLESTAVPKDRAFGLLNSAFLEEGVVVDVPRDTAVATPVQLRFEASPAQIRHPRVLIRADRHSQATVVLDHRSPALAKGSTEAAPGLTNVVIEAALEEGASLDLVILQREDDSHFHVSNVTCSTARDARFRSHTLSFGGALVRNDLDVLLAGEGGGCDLRGLFLGSGSRVVDNHTSVDHAVPHCNSRELYKGILGGQSKGVFRGRVMVRPDAQKTDAVQSNPNLILGPGAEIDTKPQLEIYADDVKCAHGATVGRLDEDALFYLQSRCIGLQDARELMIRAFANEVVDNVPASAISEAISQAITGALELALDYEEASP